MFKVGDYIVRREDALTGPWTQACEARGLNPREPMLVTKVNLDGDPVIGTINLGPWWGDKFNKAVDPNKDLKDYL